MKNIIRLICCCTSILVGGYLIFGDAGPHQKMWRVKLGFGLLALGLFAGNAVPW